jgi:hypothetical protein
MSGSFPRTPVIMAKKKRAPKKDLVAIDLAAKRKAQKEQGAFDGRFRPRVVKDKKRHSRKKPPPPDTE